MAKKTRFVISILFSAILIIVSVAASIEPAGASNDFTGIDGYIHTAMQKHNIPGVALAITQGNEIVYARGYGNAVTADTPFYIGSQSKSFTALAIMQLVEQGLLELDKPVQTYLPWFRVADEQASREITIRNLLQHTSGLSEAGYIENFPPDASLEMLVRDLSRAKSTALVGTKMQYFNPGYSTLGLIIETVSEQTFGDYLREHIFEPLKMEHTFTDPVEAQAAGLAQGHSQVFMLALPLDQTFYASDLPAGFIMSSANDMARYLMALANGGELDGARVLKPENVQMIFTPNTAIDSTYGFGWYISKYYGETQITHGGDTERFHTSVLILPQRSLSLVMLFNDNHMIKDYNEYNTLFWSVVALLTGESLPAEGVSSIVYGWGLFIIWLVVLASTVHSLLKLPQWRTKMQTWGVRQRCLDILKHLLWIAFTILVVMVVVPAFLRRGFSWVWFTGFLPDVAVVVATLVFNDAVQVVLKLWMMAKSGQVVQED